MAFDAGAVVAKIQAQVDNFKAGMETAKQELDKVQSKAKDFSKSMKETGEKVTKVGKNLSLKVTAPIVAAGTAAVKFAADLEDAIGATDQIFGSASRSMQDWANNLESYYGIAEAEALTYANTMGSMLQNIGGLSEAEAAKQSQTLLRLAGDLTAMFGGTTEDAVRALTGALKGNNTMLDNYGMAVNEAMIKTKALEMGLIRQGEEMTLAAKQGATLALIMEQTGAAQGQAAREAEGTSGTIRSLLTVLKNVSAEFGQVLLPIITPLIAKVRDWVQKFSDLSPVAKKVILIIAGIAAAIGPLLVVIGTLITSIGAIAGVVGAAIAPVLAVIAVIAALVAAFVLAYRNSEAFRDKVNAAIAKIKEIAVNVFTEVAAFIQDIIARIQEFWDEHGEMIMEAVQNVWNFVAGVIEWVMPYILAIIKNVWNTIGGVISGAVDIIMGIVHFFSALFTGNWEELWEAVKEILGGAIQVVQSLLGGVLENIKICLSGAWDLIKGIPGKLWDLLKQTISNVIQWGLDINAKAKQAVMDVINTVVDWFKSLPGKVWDWLVEVVVNLIQWGLDMKDEAKTAVSDLIDNIITWFKDLPGNLVQVGKDMIQGLVDGVNSMVSGAVDAVKGVGSKIVGGVKDFFGIGSPSKLFEGFGLNLGEGLANGIEATRRMVTSAADRIALAATPSFAGVDAFGMPTNGTFNNSTTNNVPINIYVTGNPTQDGVNQIENAAYNGVSKAVQRRRIRSARL